MGADPREYTEEYVNRAIERYDEYGLEPMKAYYNSVASFEGEFYLFAMDENDIYLVHPIFPRLIGTDIKDVVGSDGQELGKEIAQATEDGIWVEYLWPYPVTLADAPKVAYAKRHDGYIFASGYYPLPDDPKAYTRDYIQKAIDMYESDGLEAVVAHYNSREHRRPLVLGGYRQERYRHREWPVQQVHRIRCFRATGYRSDPDRAGYAEGD